MSAHLLFLLIFSLPVRGFVGAVPSPSDASPPYAYYLPGNNSDGVWKDRESGVEGIYWNGSPLGHYDLGLGPPPITLFTWDDDSSSPFPAKPDSFYLEYDALYSVLAGNVSVNGNPTPLMVGDQYYARAGTKHGPLVPLTPGAMVMLVGGPWSPTYGSLDLSIADDATSGDQPERFYFARLNATKVDDYVVPGAYDLSMDKISLSDPPYRRVVWQPSSVLGPHMHPSGIMYVPLSGHICFPGEMCIEGGQGAARWAAPGYYYDGEMTDDTAGVDLLVLGHDAAADFDDSSPNTVSYLRAKHISMNRVVAPVAASARDGP
jgi:hypothetical protein